MEPIELLEIEIKKYKLGPAMTDDQITETIRMFKLFERSIFLLKTDQKVSKTLNDSSLKQY